MLPWLDRSTSASTTAAANARRSQIAPRSITIASRRRREQPLRRRETPPATADSGKGLRLEALKRRNRRLHVLLLDVVQPLYRFKRTRNILPEKLLMTIEQVQAER
jgi:hypothetical protein